MPVDFWPRLAISAMGAAMAYWTLQEARSPSPDPRYSSPAVRVVHWLISLAMILMGLSGTPGKGLLLVIAFCLMTAALLWWLCLMGSTIVAPRWAARVWFRAFHAACAIGPNPPVVTMPEAERAARTHGFLLVGSAVLVFAGYYVATRWLGIFLLPVAFVLVVAIATLHVFRPRRTPKVLGGRVATPS